MPALQLAARRNPVRVAEMAAKPGLLGDAALKIRPAGVSVSKPFPRRDNRMKTG